MTIDKSGKWWKGSSAEDISDYLDILTSQSYPIHKHKLSKCECGSETFMLHWIPDEGAVKRICSQCVKEHFVCDSEENWSDDPDDIETLECIECGAAIANFGVAFSLYEDQSAIRWIYTGYRCVHCGVLGSFADWKIGYEPSIHLLNHG